MSTGTQDGRKSVDAMIIAGCIVGALTDRVLILDQSWPTTPPMASGPRSASRGPSGSSSRWSMSSKDKLWWALASLLIPVAGIPPAVRLAKPHSIWARLFYCDSKRARARERYGDGAGAPAAGAPPDSATASSGAGQSSS